MSGAELLFAAASSAGTALQTVGAVLNAEQKGKVARSNAIQTRDQSAEEARIASAESRRRVATARVRAGASGLSVDGSALDVIGDLEAEGEFRARTAIHEGRVRYDAYRAEQKQAKKDKTLAVVAGAAKIGSTVLTAGMNSFNTVSASQVGSMRDVGKVEQFARGL